MAALVIRVVPVRVSNQVVMLVRLEGAWHVLTRRDGKLEPRRMVPDQYATALIEAYADPSHT